MARPADRFLQLREAAEYLGVHYTTLRRWAQQRRIAYSKGPGFCSRMRFKLSDLDKLDRVAPLRSLQEVS